MFMKIGIPNDQYYNYNWNDGGAALAAATSGNVKTNHNIVLGNISGIRNE